MSKTILVALVAALAGALTAEVARHACSPNRLIAQEPGQPFPQPPVPQQQQIAPQQQLAPRTGVVSRLPAPPNDLELSPEERINVAVYEKVNRSVVNIKTETVRTDAFFFLATETPGEGAGSGSVLDTAGHILTNYHVIDDARAIEVTLFDGKSYEARVVGHDESNDVAVLKIDAPANSLVPVEIGDSTNLRVGQRVFAIGNPFGFERTMSIGIISSLNRTLPARNARLIKSVIQIDAAINPGSSGGPLLDGRGRLIGMNTAIASPTGQSAGVGFAIPSSNITRIVPQLLERGRVIRPDAGITHVYPTERGLLVAAMAPGGPAEQAGLRGFRITNQRRRQGPLVYESRSLDRSTADLILAVDGEPVTTPTEFLSAIESRQPGEEVVITIEREGRQLRVPLRLAADNS